MWECLGRPKPPLVKWLSRRANNPSAPGGGKSARCLPVAHEGRAKCIADPVRITASTCQTAKERAATLVMKVTAHAHLLFLRSDSLHRNHSRDGTRTSFAFLLLI